MNPIKKIYIGKNKIIYKIGFSASCGLSLFIIMVGIVAASSASTKNYKGLEADFYQETEHAKVI